MTTRLNSPAEMQALGANYAETSGPGDVFALVGTLGTGKTQWTRGFLSSLDPSATVSSPTFPIVNEYTGAAIPVFHFDFYRLTSAADLCDLGWDEYLDQDGIIICEWADRFPELLPPTAIWLELKHLPDGARELSIIARP